MGAAAVSPGHRRAISLLQIKRQRARIFRALADNLDEELEIAEAEELERQEEEKQKERRAASTSRRENSGTE